MVAVEGQFDAMPSITGLTGEQCFEGQLEGDKLHISTGGSEPLVYFNTQ